MKNNIIERIYSKKSVKKIKTKVTLLGIDSKMDAIKFMNYRLIISILVFFIVLIFSNFGFIYSPIITVLVYYGYEYLVIDRAIKKRITKLDSDAIFFFEILTLSLETGRNLKGAIDITVKNLDNDLSHEFKAALSEIEYGKTLTEALNSMKERIPSDTINNVILNITQSNIFGSSIINTLYNQVDYIRDKRFLETKSIINKMPMKISVISVVFFVPIMLLLILGPILVNFING